MLNILVENTTIRKRLDQLGYSFIGVSDSPDVTIDITEFTDSDSTDTFRVDYTPVLYKSGNRYSTMYDEVGYALGDEFSKYIFKNRDKPFYAYYIYRVVEEIQYIDGVCKYTNHDSDIHASTSIVYRPSSRKFYDLCYCGALMEIHREDKIDVVPKNDTVIIVRK